MPADDPISAEVRHGIDRIHSGDNAALDEILDRVAGRLRLLARRMLGSFPTVRGLGDTDDLLQGVFIRLLRALESVRPDSVDQFYGLASELTRRELLDMARKVRGTGGTDGEFTRPAVTAGADLSGVPASADDPDDLDRWQAFHEGVGRLPAQERQVIELTFYQGWPRQQVAAHLGVDVRTVHRRYAAALETLRENLADDLVPPRRRHA